MEQVKSDDRLLRRIQFLDPNFIKDDGSPASSSFSLKTGEVGLSVDIARLTTYSKSIQDSNRFRLYSLLASFTSSLGLKNIHDPIEGNYSHCLIIGNISRGIARKLAKSAIRINYPH